MSNKIDQNNTIKMLKLPKSICMVWVMIFWNLSQMTKEKKCFKLKNLLPCVRNNKFNNY